MEEALPARAQVAWVRARKSSSILDSASRVPARLLHARPFLPSSPHAMFHPASPAGIDFCLPPFICCGIACHLVIYLDGSPNMRFPTRFEVAHFKFALWNSTLASLLLHFEL